jgi:hypothetical protein
VVKAADDKAIRFLAAPFIEDQSLHVFCRLNPAPDRSTLRTEKFPLACGHSSRNKFPRPAGAPLCFALTGEPPAFAVFSLMTSQGWSRD